MTTPLAEVPTGADAALRLRGDTVIGRLLRQPLTVAAIGYLAVLALAALAAPLLAPYAPDQTHLRAILQTPSADHWLGTDELGRDMFSRMLFASRASLLACVEAVGIATVVGATLGVVSGYFGGLVDRVIMTVIDAVLSVPGLLLALAIVGALGTGLTNAMIALAVIFVPIFARLCRIQALAVREEVFMEAARAIGVSRGRAILRHVIPNIAAPVLVQVFITLGVAIVAEGSMSYLGLSIQPPEVSWGLLLQRAFAVITQAPWLIFIPGAVITLTVLAFQITGDGLARSLVGVGQRSGGQR
jgi:ABC-type dipeptide/oligopeptide/nickel transport system permease subunit